MGTLKVNRLLSVVVPCLNEEANLGRFEGELFAVLDALDHPYEVLAVDDGSSDRTFNDLSQLARRCRGLRALRHPDTRGMGAALRTGFAAAKGEWIATLDADLTFRPSQLRGLLERQKQTHADMVVGSPFLSPGGLSKVPWSRRMPTKAINALYRAVFGRAITAYTQIFRLYRTSILRTLPLWSSGFEINAEIATRFILGGHRVTETPAILSTRAHGVSKLRPLPALARHASLIARLKKLRVQTRS